MLPPESRTPTGPSPPARPASTAASAAAPAPSTEQFRALEAEDERLADLVVVDANEVVERLSEDRHGQLTRILDHDPVGDREPRLCLHSDDPHARPHRAQRERDPSREPTPADRQHECADVGKLVRQLEADRSLPGDHAQVFERMHEGGAGALGEGESVGERLLEALAGELDLRAVRTGRFDLRHRRVLWDEDRRRTAGRSRRPGDRLAVIAGACRNDPNAPFVGPEGRDRVVGAPDLERPGPLQVLGLQPDLPPRQARKFSGGVHGRLPRNAREPVSRRLDLSDWERLHPRPRRTR